MISSAGPDGAHRFPRILKLTSALEADLIYASSNRKDAAEFPVTAAPKEHFGYPQSRRSHKNMRPFSLPQRPRHR
jgi:hypothetical protein